MMTRRFIVAAALVAGILVGLNSALAQGQGQGQGQGRRGGGGGGGFGGFGPTTQPLAQPRGPRYPFAYGAPREQDITPVLTRVVNYLEACTPARIVHRETFEQITDLSTFNPDATMERGLYSITSYEWGVTYSGMLHAHEATGEARFQNYVAHRMRVLAKAAPYFRGTSATEMAREQAEPPPANDEERRARNRNARRAPLRQVNFPGSLDDSGSMCAAMIKAHRAGLEPQLRPIIDNYINYISTRQMRLSDGTLARNNPQRDSLWLDDLYMSVPALAQMGKLTGEVKYYDDACKQILQFASRMFVPEKGIWMHGWTTNTDDHPNFFWARANGWAIMATVELLEVLPEDHPKRAEVLALLKAHIKGLSTLQSGDGLWHNLLDHDETYLETSASAMFVYAMARAMKHGWISPMTYGPMTLTGWQAVAGKVNEYGQVEDVCIGTGMGFDPAFYYYRPRSTQAAHGYGPVLLAGAEVIELLKKEPFRGEGGGGGGAVQHGRPQGFGRGGAATRPTTAPAQ